MRFFKSKDVKIFPCSNRGTYTYSSKDLVFDPESRRASEYNFTHLSGRDLGKDSYVISYDDTSKLLKVVLGGYYFEIHTEFEDLTFAQPDGNLGSTYNLDECTLWLTLQKIAISNATSADSARSTQQLASLFSRVLVSGTNYKNYDYYATATDTTGELYYLTPEVVADSEEGNTWWEIDPSCINLSTLDFPATYRSDAQTGSSSDPKPEYFCAAIGITSPGSAKPSLDTDPESGYYPIISDEGEDLSGCLISLDLSKAENWLENIAADNFLYTDTTGLISSTNNIRVKELTATDKLLAPKDLTATQATITQITSCDEATITKISDCDEATITNAFITDAIIETCTIADMTKIVLDPKAFDEAATKEPISLETCVDNKISAKIDDVRAYLQGDLKITSPGVIPEVKLDDKISITAIYGSTQCTKNPNFEGEWSANAENAWETAPPTNLTLTDLQKQITCLTQAGGEPNKINAIQIGQDKLLDIESGGIVDLDGQLTLANLSDHESVALIADLEALESQIASLDHIMNFRGVISPGLLLDYTKGTTYGSADEAPNIEVGDVVIVNNPGGFDYLGQSYHTGTEFICTQVLAVPEVITVGTGDSAETVEIYCNWQEIGSCNITEGILKGVIEDAVAEIHAQIGPTPEEDLGEGEVDTSIIGRLTTIENKPFVDTELTIASLQTNIENAVVSNTTFIEAVNTKVGELVEGYNLEADAIAAVEKIIDDYISDENIEGKISNAITTADIPGHVNSALNDANIPTLVENKALELVPSTVEAQIDDLFDLTKSPVSSTVSLVNDKVNNQINTYSATRDFTTVVDDKVLGYLEKRTLASEDLKAIENKVQAATVIELNKLSVADIEFPEDPADPNSSKIKIEDKVNNAFLNEAAAINLDTLTFVPSTGGEAITIATAVSDTFTKQINDTDPTGAISGIVSNTFSTQITSQTSAAERTVRDNINTLISNDLEEIKAARDLGNGQTVGTSVTTEINDIISSNIEEIAATRCLSNDETDTVGAAITSRLNSVIPGVIENHEFSEEQTNGIKGVISDQVTALITSTNPEDKYTFTAEQNNDITDLIEGQVTDLIERYEIADGGEAMNALSGLVNGLFQQAWVLYAVAFDGNGADSSTPMPMAAINGCGITLPNEITRTGYEFRGWSTTESEADKVQSPYKVLGNQILHAIWQENVPETED